MDEPLVVPGHPVDNPPTDDFWPHLSQQLDPVFYADDGSPVGPISTLGARWVARSPGPVGFGPLPLISDALLALTDSRIIVLGRTGIDAPPDRRLVTQFRYVWCSALEWDFGDRVTPATISLRGMSQGEQIVERTLSFRLPPGAEVRGLAQDLLQRIARQYLRLDLVDRAAAVSTTETEMDYLRELAGSAVDPSEHRATVPFPRFRWIRHDDDYRLGGPEVREQMVHAQFATD